MAKIRLYKKAENKKDKPGWMLDYYLPNGKRKRKVFWGTKSQARDRLAKIQAEIWDIKQGLKKRIRPDLTIQELADKYYKYQDNLGRSPLTIDRIKVSVKAFIDIIGNLVIRKIEREDIEFFKTKRRNKCTAGGVNADLRHLKAMFNYSYQMNHILQSPFVGVKNISDSKKDRGVRFLSKREYLSLLQEIKDDGDTDLYDIVRFYLYSGARARQLLPPLFTWNNVEQDRIMLAEMKQSNARFVIMNDEMRSILEYRRTLSEPFPYSYYNIYKRIKSYYRQCGIKDADMNTLRKTCGAVLIQKGWDIYRVSKYLGHSSVTVTEKHYVDLLEKDYKQLSDSLSEEFDPTVSYLPDLSHEEPVINSNKK